MPSKGLSKATPFLLAASVLFISSWGFAIEAAYIQELERIFERTRLNHEQAKKEVEKLPSETKEWGKKRLAAINSSVEYFEKVIAQAKKGDLNASMSMRRISDRYRSRAAILARAIKAPFKELRDSFTKRLELEDAITELTTKLKVAQQARNSAELKKLSAALSKGRSEIRMWELSYSSRQRTLALDKKFENAPPELEKLKTEFEIASQFALDAQLKLASEKHAGAETFKKYAEAVGLGLQVEAIERILNLQIEIAKDTAGSKGRKDDAAKAARKEYAKAIKAFSTKTRAKAELLSKMAMLEAEAEAMEMEIEEQHENVMDAKEALNAKP